MIRSGITGQVKVSRDESQVLSKMPLHVKAGDGERELKNTGAHNIVWPFNDSQPPEDSMFRPIKRRDKFVAQTKHLFDSDEN